MKWVLFVFLSLLAGAWDAGAQSTRADQHAASLPQLLPWTGDFDGIQKRRVVRILVPYSRTLFFIDRGRQYGVVAELGQRLETWLNVRHKTRALGITVAFIPVPRDELLRALNEGRGDIAAANLTITPERLTEVDFAEPWTAKAKEIVVTGPVSPALTSLDDLAGSEVYVRESSSYAGLAAVTPLAKATVTTAQRSVQNLLLHDGAKLGSGTFDDDKIAPLGLCIAAYDLADRAGRVDDG